MKKKELKSSEKRNGCLFLLIIFIGFVMYIYFSTPTPKSESEMTRTELIERQFSAWDGSHPALERLIKKSMNDSDSYEHIETRYTDNKDYGDKILVITKFKGKNAFGGVVVNQIRAYVDIKGNVVEILSQ